MDIQNIGQIRGAADVVFFKGSSDFAAYKKIKKIAVNANTIHP
jgi:hypothetical protein